MNLPFVVIKTDSIGGNEYYILKTRNDNNPNTLELRFIEKEGSKIRIDGKGYFYLQGDIYAPINVKISNTSNGNNSTKYTIHTVKSGESLWSIFGSNWQEGMKYNGLKSQTIYPGQKLKVKQK